MERMGPRRAGDENGVGTTAGRAGVVRVTAVTAAVVAALAGCSVTVQPKNAAATRPLTSSTPTPSATASSTTSAAPSTSTLSTSAASPTATPSDVDHTVCSNVRDVLATLKSKLVTDKDSDSRMGQDYRTAGTALRVQDTKTDNTDLKSTLKTVGTDYQNVGRDFTNHASSDDDLAKAAEASKPLSTLCGGGSSPSSASSTTGN